MNMLSGVTALTGFVSSASSFSDLQVSGSLLLTGEGQGEKKIWTRLGQVREGDEEDIQCQPCSGELNQWTMGTILADDMDESFTKWTAGATIYPEVTTLQLHGLFLTSNVSKDIRTDEYVWLIYTNFLKWILCEVNAYSPPPPSHNECSENEALAWSREIKWINKAQCEKVYVSAPSDHKPTAVPVIVESSRDDWTLGTSMITLELSWDLSWSCSVSLSSLLLSRTAAGDWSDCWGVSTCFSSPTWLWSSGGSVSPPSLLSPCLKVQTQRLDWTNRRTVVDLELDYFDVHIVDYAEASLLTLLISTSTVHHKKNVFLA